MVGHPQVKLHYQVNLEILVKYLHILYYESTIQKTCDELKQLSTEPSAFNHNVNGPSTLTKVYYVYILTCVDSTLYTGITTCVERRLKEHNETTKGAKYTRARRPVTLAAVWQGVGRSWAAREEARIKKLSRKAKLSLIDTFTSEKQH